jgi:hypothetical protein
VRSTSRTFPVGPTFERPGIVGDRAVHFDGEHAENFWGTRVASGRSRSTMRLIDTTKRNDRTTTILINRPAGGQMRFHLDASDSEYSAWLGTRPSESDLRAGYFALEGAREALWTPGHIDSFRRDRYELDARYVRRLVQVKQALASEWTETGQLSV